ncbi:MAG: tRNA 4-thiouridine(8) synthase ThiI [Candidatus Pacebacteria bacterium]|nr:tRNA 4-thiouridine(8) synthase ThiI [Candidatus Paceibacterota bacterium]
MTKNIKALVLFSGGLDSMLSALILRDREIRVTPMCFFSYFFNCDKASSAAKEIGFKLRKEDFSAEQLKIVKSPRYGRGSGMNPCVDCHLLMLKKAGRIMKKEGYDFVVTGEVLGQRPFSQNKGALELMERKAGLKGMIVRPLSLKLLPKTIPEKKGLIQREWFYDIRGRSRKPQLALAGRFKIKNVPTPAGGCILTDPVFSQRLKKLFELKKNFNGSDVDLVKSGRVFFKGNVLIVVARNEAECKELLKKRKRGDLVLEPYSFPGPTVLVRKIKKSSREEMIDCGIKLLLDYTKNVPEDPVIEILPFPKSY